MGWESSSWAVFSGLESEGLTGSEAARRHHHWYSQWGGTGCGQETWASLHGDVFIALLESPHACWVASPTESDPRGKAKWEMKWLVLPSFLGHISMSTISYELAYLHSVQCGRGTSVGRLTRWEVWLLLCRNRYRVYRIEKELLIRPSTAWWSCAWAGRTSQLDWEKWLRNTKMDLFSPLKYI